MASLPKVEQFNRERLFDLLLLEKQNKGSTIIGLNGAIAKAKAPMSEKSIAWVEKLVSQA